MATKTRTLLQDLNRSNQSFYDALKNPQQRSNQEPYKSNKRPPSSIRLSKQKIRAKSRYQDLTNMTKQQQKSMMWDSMILQKRNNKDWSHAYYTGNNKKQHVSKTFSNLENNQVNQFPHNNTKYNIQFLDRSLHGQSLKLPRSESGQFKKPSNTLYSKHYQPIVQQKTKLNEDWELSPSKFGKIHLDFKRDRIMNNYQIQANPFRTPKSNSLISKITKSQIY